MYEYIDGAMGDFEDSENNSSSKFWKNVYKAEAEYYKNLNYLNKRNVMTNYEMVLEFHKAFNCTQDKWPPSFEERDLRDKLMNEELAEFEYEIYSDDKPSTVDKKNTAKELADLLYVVYGTAVSFGIDIDKVFKEVHRSNMSKLGEDGKPIYREDGKVLKGPGYTPAQLDLFV